jgi:hypothetical protein
MNINHVLITNNDESSLDMQVHVCWSCNRAVDAPTGLDLQCHECGSGRLVPQAHALVGLHVFYVYKGEEMWGRVLSEGQADGTLSIQPDGKSLSIERHPGHILFIGVDVRRLTTLQLLACTHLDNVLIELAKRGLASTSVANDHGRMILLANAMYDDGHVTAIEWARVVSSCSKAILAAQ